MYVRMHVYDPSPHLTLIFHYHTAPPPTSTQRLHNTATARPAPPGRGHGQREHQPGAANKLSLCHPGRKGAE